jgi:hypothetical protein
MHNCIRFLKLTYSANAECKTGVLRPQRHSRETMPSGYMVSYFNGKDTINSAYHPGDKLEVPFEGSLMIYSDKYDEYLPCIKKCIK